MKTVRPGTPARTGAAARSPLKTLSEQLADELGGDIANGIIKPGERLREVSIAEAHGVSRAPVREAIRILARRELVEFHPRRGAFAVELTVEKLIDTFNVMAVLIGLATRYFTVLADADTMARLELIVAALEELADDPDCDPLEFAFAAARVAAFINRHCGSEQVASLLHHQLNNSVWNTLWRNRPIDFFTRERRREAAAMARLRLGAMIEGDGDRAVEVSCAMTDLARDHAVAAFITARGAAPSGRARLRRSV